MPSLDEDALLLRHVYHVDWRVRYPEGNSVKNGCLPYVIPLMSRIKELPNKGKRNLLMCYSRSMMVRNWYSTGLHWRSQLSPYLEPTYLEVVGPLPESLGTPGAIAANGQVNTLRKNAIAEFLERVYVVGYEAACKATPVWKPSFLTAPVASPATLAARLDQQLAGF